MIKGDTKITKIYKSYNLRNITQTKVEAYLGEFSEKNTIRIGKVVT